MPGRNGDKKKTAAHRAMCRQQQVANLYLQGKTQTEIAEIVKVTQCTVSSDLGKIREDWRNRCQRDWAERLAEEFARLDDLESIAREAYAKSQVAVVQRIVDGKRVTQRLSRPGDSRYLEQIRKCIELRLKAMGALQDVNINLAPTIAWDSLMQASQSRVSCPYEATIAEASKPPLEISHKDIHPEEQYDATTEGNNDGPT